MPGWDQLPTAAAMHDGFALAGLILLAALVGLTGLVGYQLRRGGWPEWLDVGQYQVRSRFVEIGIVAVLTMLLGAEVLAYSYGARQTTLAAAAEQERAALVKKLAAQAKARPETPNHYLKENSDLRHRLDEAEAKVAALEKTQHEKRLSPEQRRFMVEALRPYAGQKVSIASIRGDNDGLILAQDFVAVFEAAGWDHHGEAGVTTQEWPRDPIGVEITLNEDDARRDHIADGVVALINTVRKLGLVYDGTIYMDNEVPAGQALVKIGKKLRK
jgi:hypothetical protein